MRVWCDRWVKDKLRLLMDLLIWRLKIIRKLHWHISLWCCGFSLCWRKILWLSISEAGINQRQLVLCHGKQDRGQVILFQLCLINRRWNLLKVKLKETHFLYGFNHVDDFVGDKNLLASPVVVVRLLLAQGGWSRILLLHLLLPLEVKEVLPHPH